MFRFNQFQWGVSPDFLFVEEAVKAQARQVYSEIEKSPNLRVVLCIRNIHSNCIWVFAQHLKPRQILSNFRKVRFTLPLTAHNNATVRTVSLLVKIRTGVVPMQCVKRGTCSVLQCYCKKGYTGDGVNCTIDAPPSDCQDIYDRVSTESGIYKIKPTMWQGDAFDVYCIMTDDRGWTVRLAFSIFFIWRTPKVTISTLQSTLSLGSNYPTYRKELFTCCLNACHTLFYWTKPRQNERINAKFFFKFL